eukprot:228476-Chlamydomonas_euryale.AAC.2
MQDGGDYTHASTLANGRQRGKMGKANRRRLLGEVGREWESKKWAHGCLPAQGCVVSPTILHRAAA